MAVVIETTLGNITVDLYLEQRPVTCLNFLKLCKMKYYNFNLFHTIRNGFIAQTGDPTGEGSGGQSIWGILEGPEKRFFSGEKMPKIRHTDAGLLSMVCTDDMMVGSQFFLTLAPDLDSLDGTHCVIGEVTEGHEVLTKINEVICDENHRPYRDVRITHTVILEDPFSDPVGLRAPSRSPSPNPERLKGGRIAPDEEINEMQGKSIEEIQEMIEEKEAKARATILEIVGDLPDAEIAPPENVLFVCKLNPVTTDEDLEIIFSRFGTIVSCEVIKDKKTGNSLQYAFIEFENKKSCEDAYFKMDNVLIDDRRIHVDFSQSVSKMRWLGKGRGVQYFDNDSIQVEEKQDNKDNRRYRNESRKNIHDNHRDERDNKQEHDGNIEQRHDKDREHRRDRDREHKYKRDREYNRENREHRYVRDREQNHDIEHRHIRRPDKEQKRSREEQNRDREHRQYRDKEQKYERDRGNAKDRSRSRSRLSESRKNRPESDTERSSARKNGDTYEHRYNSSRSDKLKHLPIRRNKNDFTASRSNEESEHKESRSDKRYEKNHKHNHKNKKGHMRYSNHTEQHDHNKHTESQKETGRSGQQNEEPLTPSPTLKRKNDKHSNKNMETKSSKVNKRNNRKKKSRPSTSTSESSSSTSSSDSSSSSESDGKKKKLRSKRRKHSTSSSSTESSSSSSSYSSSSSSSSDREHKKKKHRKIKKKNRKNKQKL